LRLSCYGVDEPILSEAIYRAQQYLPAVAEQIVKLTHGQDLACVPDDVSFGSYRGMHVMVSLNTKHKRTQCIWLALAILHFLSG
jgi:hypothetical protein